MLFCCCCCSYFCTDITNGYFNWNSWQCLHLVSECQTSEWLPRPGPGWLVCSEACLNQLAAWMARLILTGIHRNPWQYFFFFNEISLFVGITDKGRRIPSLSQTHDCAFVLFLTITHSALPGKIHSFPLQLQLNVSIILKIIMLPKRMNITGWMLLQFSCCFWHNNNLRKTRFKTPVFGSSTDSYVWLWWSYSQHCYSIMLGLLKMLQRLHKRVISFYCIQVQAKMNK